MGLDFSYPWLLLLLPVCVAAILLIHRKYALPSLKGKVTLGARLLVVTLLVLAIASPSLMMKAGTVTRWILLDVSDSARDAMPQMEAAVTQALANLPDGEQAGVIAFGKGAMVELTPSGEPVFTGVHTAVGGDDSDLDDALLLANALLPADGAGGVTVISDGATEVSQAVAGMMNGRGVKVDALTFQQEQRQDAQLSELIAPVEVYEGQSVTVEAVIDANAAFSGELALYQNGQLISSRDISLTKSENRFAFREVAQQTGVVTYEARLLLSGDSQSRNNSAAAYVRVNGAPNILLVSDDDGVNGLFSAAGMKLTAVRPAELPARAEDYLPYDAVVLNNIDYDAAVETQWLALDSAVRTLGRGLCVLGGDRSYALGSYRGTLLEELLPVRIDVRNKLQLPSLSLMLCIDKSGSMSSGQYGTANIEVAKEAAIASLEVLTPRDYIGVIGFDGAAKWVVPFQQVTDVAAIESMIGTLRADGGTAFFSALQMSLDTLDQSTTAQKHVIFLSDGAPGDSGFEEIVAAMRQDDITLTTVAIGNGADVRLMNRLAAIGGGRSYQANEFTNVPKIFAKETMLAGGSYVQNRVFTPVITEDSPLTAYDGFPLLNGYLSAVEKETATVSLVSDTDDPLLARWNIGAGKVLCWLSDAEGAWTENLLRWEEAPAFFGGMAAAVMPGADREGTLSAAVDDDRMTITYALEGESEAELTTEVTVIAPDGGEQTVVLNQTEPGIYEGTAAADAQGAYALRLTQAEGDNVLRTQESGAVKSYAREYDLRQATRDGLEQLVAQTGGRQLEGIEGVWDTPVNSSVSRNSLRHMLLLLVLIFWLADIALRKLPWDDAVLKLMGIREAKRTQRPAEKPKPAKPVKRVPSKSEQNKQRQQEAGNTANALLNAKKARRGE